MSQETRAALRSDLALLDHQRRDRLILRARELYRLGFAAISPSQMEAVAELVRRAESLEDARADVEAWMAKALEKLEARLKRTKKTESWLLAPTVGEGDDSLGKLLVEWVKEERYLEPEPPRELDGLAALRQFWGRLHGLCRYRVEMGEDMPLFEALDMENDS